MGTNEFKHNGGECVLNLKFIAGYFYFEAELYWDETINKGAIVCLFPKIVFFYFKPSRSKSFLSLQPFCL